MTFAEEVEEDRLISESWSVASEADEDAGTVADADSSPPFQSTDHLISTGSAKGLVGEALPPKRIIRFPPIQVEEWKRRSPMKWRPETEVEPRPMEEGEGEEKGPVGKEEEVEPWPMEGEEEEVAS